jgi:hypothetical protein
MSENLETSVDPYLDSFAESFAAANYKAATITTYRSIIRKLGQVMDAECVEPSALTLDQAERLGRMVPRKRGQTICPHNLARRFAKHLVGYRRRAAPAADGGAGRACGVAGGLRDLSRQATGPQPAYDLPHAALRAPVP